MKKAYETLKDDMNKQKNNELEQLKLQIAALTMKEETKTIRAVREDIKEIKRKYSFFSSKKTYNANIRNFPDEYNEDEKLPNEFSRKNMTNPL